MSSFGIAIAVSLAAAGALIAYVGMRAQRPVLDMGQYFQDLDDEVGPVDEYERRLAEPFVMRVVHPLGQVLGGVTRLTPRNYVAGVHKKLLHAGLANSIRAEEFVTGQVALTGVLTVGAILWLIIGAPSSRFGLLVVLLLPGLGILGPSAWLAGKVDDRKSAILKDLPDTLDLLAISVEAGMGFEGALDVVCQHFNSPLSQEFHRTLREMELGLPRRDAFQNLKRRTEVPDLSNFVLALMQADALGIPVGRVLRTQAAEMRNKRRQWAREKAAKLPVKMLIPLTLFIFPAIMIVILGPAADGFVNVLG
ncbi:MAG: type II secretion system F family protein [Acidimicrobiales bacterium]|nr:type II secretion system F family protein [Actinomycetota bacterium]